MSARAPVAHGPGAGKVGTPPPDVLYPGHREPPDRVLKPGHREARCEVLKPVVRVRKAGDGAEGPRRRGVRVAGGVPELEAAWGRKFGEEVPFQQHPPGGSRVGASPKGGNSGGEPERPSVRLPEPRSRSDYAHRASGLGFNAVPFQAYEFTQANEADGDDATWAWRKYGDTPNLLRDLEALGATFVRQPKLIDLSWPNDIAIPLVTGSDLTPLKDAFRSGPNSVYEQLVAFFVTSFSREDREAPPIQLVFTWLTVLAQVEPEAKSSLTDPLGEIWVETIVPLTWHEDHLTANLKGRLPEIVWWDGQDFTMAECITIRNPTSRVSLGPQDKTWAIGTLDPRSPYKLYYVYLLGRAVGELLLEVEADVQAALGEEASSTFSVFDHIVGIELCNEVNIKNVVLGEDGLPAASESARLWMRVVREGIRGFREALGDARIDLWLPSLWSYSIPDDEAVATAGAEMSTFRYTLAFDRELLTWVSVWDSIADDDECDSQTDAKGPEWPPVDRSWITNQDYHWYHYKGSGAPVIQLVAEAEALRGLFQTTGLEALVGADVTLSVCETGSTVYKEDLRDNDDYPYWAHVIAQDTAAREGVDPAAYPFQAAEVWRRLATALCVARHVSWHTHMSSTASGRLPYFPGDANDADTNPFHDMGVRDDFRLDSARSTTAALAYQRPSWWAWQRLSTVLASRAAGERGGWRGRLLSRPPDPGNYYQAHNGIDRRLFRAIPANMVVALGFYLGEDGDELGMRYAYLLFLDPAVFYDATEKGPRPSVDVFVLNESGSRTVLYPTVPDAPTVHAWGVELVFPDDSPPWEFISWGPACGVRIGSVRLRVGDPPVLLTSERELGFEW